MRQGKLMDDKAVYALLMAHLSPGGEGHAEYSRSHTIILDGVIKEAKNIQSFEEALKEFNEQPASTPMDLRQVINISASEGDLIARQESRVKQAIAAGAPQRPDDDVNVYRGRLSAYMTNTQKIIAYYQSNANFDFTDVDSSQGIEQTTNSLLQVMKSVPRISNNATPALRS
jgi:adenylate kinase family enzyme